MSQTMDGLKIVAENLRAAGKITEYTYVLNAMQELVEMQTASERKTTQREELPRRSLSAS